MDVSDAESELSKYIGLPKCQDCGWKLGSDITDNCSCRGELTKEQLSKHETAFNRARELQAITRIRGHLG